MTVNEKIYWYKLESVDFYGDVTLGGIVSAMPSESAYPDKFSLFQNHPNPFNPGTTIPFEIKEETKVVISVYNVLGQEICRLAERIFEKGYHEIYWDGKDYFNKDMHANLYIFSMKAGEFLYNRKMILLR